MPEINLKDFNTVKISMWLHAIKQGMQLLGIRKTLQIIPTEQ